MSWVSRTLSSSIGMKTLMALSGLMMGGFLVAHLSGNLLVFAGEEALNAYAEKLRDFLPVLWILRLGLIGAVLVHILAGIRLNSLNKNARPQRYVKRDFQKTSPASRSMIYTGLVITSFFIYHLAHLTFRWTHPEFSQLGHYDVYKMLIISFQSPLLVGFYTLSIVLLMVHLSHGVTSLFQTLGFRHPNIQPAIDAFGPLLSVVLGIGFLSIPVAVLFGFIN